MKTTVKIIGIIALAAIAVFFAACPENFGLDSRLRLSGGEFVAVENITGVPTGGLPYVAIHLTATVEPEHATNKKIEWSITNDGGTQSALDENRLTADAEGTVTVRATIKNGLGEGEDYTQDFHISVLLVTPFAVKEIRGMPDALPVGQFALNGVVYPTNAVNTISYNVKNAGTTGASVSGDVLTTKTPGTVTLTATVSNGLLERGDYTEDFSIVINKAVYISGILRIYSQPDQYIACYWIDNKLYELSIPVVGTTHSYTSGVVFAGDRPYIAGYYTAGANNTVCYWVNGDRKELPESTGATATTQSHSIGADGATVYITGIVGGTYCYWKINADGTVSKKTLTNPAGTIKTTGAGAYNGRFAAGGGRVYIPFQDTSNNSFYWDENGAVNAVTELNGVNSITGAMVMNNTLYLAGANASSYPYYFAEGNAALTVLRNNAGSVNSIVKQNGALRFYGVIGSNPYCWSTSSETQISVSESYTSIVAFSDGAVYIQRDPSQSWAVYVLDADNLTFTSMISPGGIWGVYISSFTGIAVTQEN